MTTKNIDGEIARQVNECLVKRLYVTVAMKKIHEPRLYKLRHIVYSGLISADIPFHSFQIMLAL